MDTPYTPLLAESSLPKHKEKAVPWRRITRTNKPLLSNDATLEQRMQNVASQVLADPDISSVNMLRFTTPPFVFAYLILLGVFLPRNDPVREWVLAGNIAGRVVVVGLAAVGVLLVGLAVLRSVVWGIQEGMEYVARNLGGRRVTPGSSELMLSGWLL